MWTQGAVSPRSASPVGPAPTRLPRIALPVATMSLLEVQISPMHFSGGRCGPGAGLVGEAHDEIKTNDGGAPHQPQGNGEPVEVRSATEEPLMVLDMPPPNMSDRPPPLPLCNRTNSVRSRPDRTSSTCNPIFTAFT